MSEGLIGVLIGAGLAIIGGILGEIIKYNLDIGRKNKEKMKEAYEAAELCIIRTNSFEHFVSGKEYLRTVEDAVIKISIYASKRAKDAFDEISDLILKPDKSEEEIQLMLKKDIEFEDIIRADLKIDRKRPFSLFYKTLRSTRRRRGGAPEPKESAVT